MKQGGGAMTMPGFTAEKSAYTRSRYGAVLPALPPRTAGDVWANCMSDCADLHCAGKTPTACRTFCEHFCSAGIEAGPTAPNPVNQTLCQGGCWAWWVACEANPFTLGFFCNYVRDQCL